MDEIWKPIPSAPGYEASNLGNIRSVGRHVKVSGPRGGQRYIPGRIRKPCDNGAGYMHLHLTKKMHRYVHRLVAEAFFGPIPEGQWVCHNDGNPRNNKIENLRYDTAQGNEADKRRHRTATKGERSHYAKLSELQVRAIKELMPKFAQSELAQIFNVSQPTISRIATGFCWTE